MKRKSIQALALLAAAVLGGASAQADVLYDSTVAPRFDGGPNPLGYNNSNFNDAIDHIHWDDAAIFVNGIPGSYVNVTRLSFGIFRDVGAPAVNIDLYWSDMVLDGGGPIPNRGNASIPPLDSPIDDPGTPNLLGTIALTANLGGQTQQIITIGNGIDTLFTTAALNLTTADVDRTSDLNDPDYTFGQHPGYGYFFVGLNLKNTDDRNQWIIASHPHNLFYTVDDFQDFDPSTIDEFWLGPDLDGGEPIEGTMSVKVEGTIVPEPASIGMLGVMAAGLLARRRRTA